MFTIFKLLFVLLMIKLEATYVPEEILLTVPRFHLNTSSDSGIIKKVILFFKSYRYKKFNPTETSEVRNFGYFTHLAIKKFPQSIFWWGFHTIFYIELGFQPHQI